MRNDFPRARHVSRDGGQTASRRLKPDPSATLSRAMTVQNPSAACIHRQTLVVKSQEMNAIRDVEFLRQNNAAEDSRLPVPAITSHAGSRIVANARRRVE